MTAPLARRRRVACSLVCGTLGGCVTQVVETEREPLGALNVAPVRIPLGAPAGDPMARAVAAYYQSVLAQMQDALVERNLELLRGLCAVHDRPSAPPWARQQMRRFRKLSDGLELELYLESRGSIDVADPDVAIGEPVDLEFRVPPGFASDVVLPGGASSDDVAPARFLVRCEIRDFDALGGRSERLFSELLTLPGNVAGDAPDGLRLPFGIASLSPEGALRRVNVRVELAPGTVWIGGERVPNRRVPCGERELTLYPRGVEKIRENPYTNLRNALLSGDPRHFGHVFLAAHFMSDELEDDAIRLLIRQVRLGSPDLRRLSMNALAVLTGESYSVEDRDGWLAWWRRRAARADAR